MEQNILKRYNEIHIMLWEEVIKVFAAMTSNISDVKYYKENGQLNKLHISNVKRTALLHLFVRGQITEEEKNNLLMNCVCAACYVCAAVRSIEFIRDNNWESNRCECCPIKKWNSTGMYCNDYHTVESKLDDLTRYITNCITHREKFNLGAYKKLRKAVMKKMYIVAHLEWGYEQDEV